MNLKGDKSVNTSGVFSQASFMNHEQVVFCHDEATGLKAIICIHNTVLGPALGGTRMWNYASEAEAIDDVLRLSRGMTFKASIAGLDLGGGKAVIIGDAATQKTPSLLRKFGEFVNGLNGKYVTAEDVNMSPEDMAIIGQETKYVTGLSESLGAGGDPSPVTAYGVYMGMKAAARSVYGNDSLEGKVITVQGCGHVGMELIENLVRENASVIVSDYYSERALEASKKYGCQVVDLEKIYAIEADIYAPCALGATLNDNTIPQLKCAIIAGAANNQLQDEVKHAEMLENRGILYAPDFVVNAGGLINVGIDYLGGWSKDVVLDKTEGIYDKTLEIIATAKLKSITTHAAALELAEERIMAESKIKLAL